MNTKKSHEECHYICELLNDLVDRELDDEELAEAKEFVDENPTCQALYNTLLQTVELYKERSKELSEFSIPKIDWSKISSDDDDTLKNSDTD